MFLVVCNFCMYVIMYLFFVSVKPTLKKVSKYENKFAKLQKKAAEFNFRNQLKVVKKKEYTLEEEDKEVRKSIFASDTDVNIKKKVKRMPMFCLLALKDWLESNFNFRIFLEDYQGYFRFCILCIQRKCSCYFCFYFNARN